jgi:hypothetical protein
MKKSGMALSSRLETLVRPCGARPHGASKSVSKAMPRTGPESGNRKRAGKPLGPEVKREENGGAD